MSIMHISGQIMVTVDKVDVEQFQIENPARAADMGIRLLAMAAALEKEDVRAFSRQVDKANCCLQHDDTHYGMDDYLVIFKISERKIEAVKS